MPLLRDVVREATRRVRRLRRRRASSLALVRAGQNAAVRVMKLGPQSTPDDVQRVRHGGVSTQRRPLAADGLGGRRRPPLVAGQPHVTLRIKKIAERRTIWGAAAPRGPNSPRRAAAAKRIFQGRRRSSRSVPAGFWGLRAGAAHRPDALFCGSATRPNRTARGSKPTDLVLSGPRVYRLSIDRAGGGRAAASPSSTGGTKPWGSLYRCRAARGAARRRGATVERLWRRPSARRRVACGGKVCGGGSTGTRRARRRFLRGAAQVAPQTRPLTRRRSQ